MKIFIPIIAANSITAVHCEQFAVKNSVRLSFFDAAAAGIGTSFVFLLTGALREILGNGTIGGIAVDLPVTFRSAATPFGCLILLGFMAAVLKAVIMKKYPEYLEEGITFKSLSETKEPEKQEEKIEIKTEKIEETVAAEPVAEEVSEEFFALPETVEDISAEVLIEEIKAEDEIKISDFDELFKSLELEIEKRMEGDGQ
jgi:hypothetical protein